MTLSTLYNGKYGVNGILRSCRIFSIKKCWDPMLLEAARKAAYREHLDLPRPRSAPLDEATATVQSGRIW